MKIYESKNSGNFLSIMVVLGAFLGVVITVMYFRDYWYYLAIFITPLLLFSLVLPELLSCFYSVNNVYLIKQYDKKNFNDPYKTFTIDENGKRDYKATVLKIKLTDIIKIEKRKNIFGQPFIALYYSDNQSIDIYLKRGEIDGFIKEVAEK